MKNWFQILRLAPEYNLEVQAWLPAGLAAIHNFISIHNPHDQPIANATGDGTGNTYIDNDDNDTLLEAPGPNDPVHDLRQYTIAQQMWDDNVVILAEWDMIEMDDEIMSDLDENASGDDNDD